MSLLHIKDLKVSYGGIEALKGISLDVEKGQIVTLIGANGAGKSTTLRSIAGLIPMKEGTITYDGQVISGQSPQKIVSEGICLVPEGRRVFANLTVLENLRIGAYLRKDDLTPDLEHVYQLFPRLRERSWQLAGTLSGGEQQMLAVGRALMTNPQLLLLDEPMEGLAPIIVEELAEAIRRMCAQEGLASIVVEQHPVLTLSMTDQVIVLERGKVIHQGTSQALAADAALLDRMLGVTLAESPAVPA